MAQRRRTQATDLRYMEWHRADSIRRYLGRERAAKLAMIDLDCIEVCWRCSEPLVLIETKHVAAREKNGNISAHLANRAMLGCYLVEYDTDESGDLTEFWVSEWWPRRGGRRQMTPQEYAAWLWSFRAAHDGSDHPDHLARWQHRITS